ncbi:MAG TPA: HAMP domain-containing sensor histidine kinase, partial [Bacteroidia bacterium]|nr:HAMP domain-containing sensor histidine kinase [Bacteroidia bacterium]
EETPAFIQSFQKKYLRTLPGEIIRMYNEADQPVFIDSTDIFTFPKSLIDYVRKKRIYEFQDGKKQVLGILYPDNQGNFVIIVSAIDEAGRARDKQLLIVLAVGFFISIIIVFIAGRFFTKSILRPVSAITDQANNISESNLHLRLNEGNKKDELAELSMTINHMLGRLEHAFEQQKSFVSNASHELRTPLTSIIGNIEVTLTKARTEEDYKITLESIMIEAEKLQKLTNGLLDLAQSDTDFSSIKKEELRIDELLFETTNSRRLIKGNNKIDLVFPEMPEDPSSMTIRGNKGFLETALLNLIDNACKFSDGKKVTITLLLENNNIVIKIADQGIGISPDELLNIKETFYRAKNAHGYPGSGIGLTLSDKIIRMHDGILDILSSPGAGTEIKISFHKY